MAKKTKKRRRRFTRRESRQPRPSSRIGKEDAEAQKTFRARRTKISQEQNLSLDTRSSLNKRKMGHYSRPARRHSNLERRGPGHLIKADLAKNITENTVVLDIYRTLWCWIYKNDPGRGYHRVTQREGIASRTRTPQKTLWSWTYIY